MTENQDQNPDLDETIQGMEVTEVENLHSSGEILNAIKNAFSGLTGFKFDEVVIAIVTFPAGQVLFMEAESEDPKASGEMFDFNRKRLSLVLLEMLHSSGTLTPGLILVDEDAPGTPYDAVMVIKNEQEFCFVAFLNAADDCLSAHGESDSEEAFQENIRPLTNAVEKILPGAVITAIKINWIEPDLWDIFDA